MELFWLVAGAFIVGIAKTSISGLSALAVMTFAFAMPTKESTGAVLLMYLAGDLVATIRYWRNVHWRMLFQLVPWVLPGLVLGAWFLRTVDAVTLRRLIGIILVVCVLVQIVLSWVQTRCHGQDQPIKSRFGHWLGTIFGGVAAGFTTMAANTGGPVMTIYLLAKRVDKIVFVGTAAWFFFAVNLTKLPFSIAVGAINLTVFWRMLPLVPVVWLGCLFGVWVLKLIPQRLFELLAQLSAVIAGLSLILS